MNRLRSFAFDFNQPWNPVRLFFVFLCLFSIPALHAQDAFTVAGPDGGDARAFASVPGEPSHLYLGTTNSWLYESRDEGATWHRLAKLDHGDGFVIDHIVVDSAHPSTLYVGAWKNNDDGGLWISHDAARTWTEVPLFKGQPVQALAEAPSDPRILFAGTLEGVYRSADSGITWTQISPPGSHEIHEIESLAVDPANPEIVYAGTWHLPWKTTDGGKTWRNIKQGIIEDSDVFSIIVDPGHSHIVYLSACSGIYKSEDAGLLFHKIQGIPSEARRTRVLMQDPENREIVYAGTTEGLYKTVDAGKTFDAHDGFGRGRQRCLCRSRELQSRAARHRSRRRPREQRRRPHLHAIEHRHLRAQDRGPARRPQRSHASLRGRGQRQAIWRRLPLHGFRRALAAARRGSRRARRLRSGRNQRRRPRSRNQPRHLRARRRSRPVLQRYRPGAGPAPAERISEPRATP